MKIEGIHPFEFENIKISLVKAEKVVKDPKNPMIKKGSRKSLLLRLNATRTPIM